MLEQRRHLSEGAVADYALKGLFASVDAAVLPERLSRAERLAAHLAKVPGEAEVHLGQVRSHQPLVVKALLALIALEATRVLVTVRRVRAQDAHRRERLAARVALVGAVARLRVRRRVLGQAARLDALAAHATRRRSVAMHLPAVLAQTRPRLGSVKAAGCVARVRPPRRVRLDVLLQQPLRAERAAAHVAYTLSLPPRPPPETDNKVYSAER